MFSIADDQYEYREVFYEIYYPMTADAQDSEPGERMAERFSK